MDLQEALLPGAEAIFVRSSTGSMRGTRGVGGDPGAEPAAVPQILTATSLSTFRM
jgi:hypothetical protein